MNDVENKNQIIDIDGYVHVVNGKVICFGPDVYDLNNPEDVEDLVSTAAEVGTGDDRFFPALYSNDTILFLDRNTENSDELIVSMGDLRGMPEECQKKIEGVLNEGK